MSSQICFNHKYEVDQVVYYHKKDSFSSYQLEKIPSNIRDFFEKLHFLQEVFQGTIKSIGYEDWKCIYSVKDRTPYGTDRIPEDKIFPTVGHMQVYLQEHLYEFFKDRNIAEVIGKPTLFEKIRLLIKPKDDLPTSES